MEPLMYIVIFGLGGLWTMYYFERKRIKKKYDELEKHGK